MADGEAGTGIQGYDPIINGQITRAELDRCEADPTANLKLNQICLFNRRTKGPRYVPVARRGDKPDGIMWLVKHHPELSLQIIKLIGTTKETIARFSGHIGILPISVPNTRLRYLGKQADLDAAITKAGGSAQTEEQVSDISELPNPDSPACAKGWSCITAKMITRIKSSPNCISWKVNIVTSMM